MCSPLKPISFLLNMFHLIGGFPLKKCDNTFTQFRFWKHAWVHHLGIYFLPLAGYGYMISILFRVNDDFDAFKQRWKEHGLTMVDFGAAKMLLYVHILLTFGYLRAFRTSAKPISRMCSSLAIQNNLLGINLAKMWPITRRTYCAFGVLYSCYIVAVIVSVPYAYGIMQNIMASGHEKIAVRVLWVVMTSTFYWPLPAIVAFLISRQCLLTLVIQLDEFQARIPKSEELLNGQVDCKKNTIVEDEDQENENTTIVEIPSHRSFESTEDIVHAGIQQWRCISLTSDALGPFLFIDIAMCLFVTIIGAYFTPLLVEGFRFTADEYLVNIVKLSYGTHNLFLAIHAGLMWINYCRAGQRLLICTQRTKHLLEDYLMDRSKQLDQDDKIKLQVLISRFDCEAPIRPLQSMNLNLPSAISAAGLVTTYLVILIQFKLSNVDQMSFPSKLNSTLREIF